MKYRILFNPLAGNCDENSIEAYLPLPFGEEIEKYDMTKIENYSELLGSFDREDKLIICGGDGTLNRFVNSADVDNIENDILYFATGSGNDFLHDLGEKAFDKLIKINDYVRNLPELCVNGKTYKFVNGIGFGVDGYVCKEVNRLRTERKNDSKKNYTLIALKGLLFAFKPVNATVIVDGKEYKYKKVWMVTSMKGKFFGGGMMIAPQQDRANADNTVNVISAHDLSPLKIATLFPSIFRGTHIKHTKHITVHNAKTVTVRFDRPSDMQIDGETLTDVLEYTVNTKAACKI